MLVAVLITHEALFMRFWQLEGLFYFSDDLQLIYSSFNL